MTPSTKESLAPISRKRACVRKGCGDVEKDTRRNMGASVHLETNARNRRRATVKDDDCDGVVDAGCVACKSHTDCGGVGLCVDGFCDKNAQCAAASDCPTDQVCKQSRCAYCALGGADCPTGQLCLADAQKGYNRCQPVQCSVNSNCSFGLVCKQNRCQNCDPTAKDAQGNPVNECGGQSVCLQGKCYIPCVIDLDCGAAMTQRCTPMPSRAGVSSSLCLPRCTQDTDCPQGFGCSAQTCVIAPILSDGGYTPSDQLIPESCTAYRHPESGYQPQTRNGTYWIKPSNAPPTHKTPYKVYCDQSHDEGGFQLLARYTTRLNLAGFQPDKHQIQDTQTGQSLDPATTLPPNLSDITTYGHIAYTRLCPRRPRDPRGLSRKKRSNQRRCPIYRLHCV
jgi:hypothetical protein